MNDPLDMVFVTPDEAATLKRDSDVKKLTHYLKQMPPELIPLFGERFQYIGAAELAALREVSDVELAAYRYYLGESDARLIELFDDMLIDDRERYDRAAHPAPQPQKEQTNHG